MHWNYRICKESSLLPSGTKLNTYSIREVYYTDAGGIYGVTENPIGVSADDLGGTPEEECIKEIEQGLKNMQTALSRPILDLDTVEYEDINS